jgi:pyruvate carboxylase subunit B
LRKKGELKPVEEKPKGKIIKIWVGGREYEVGVEGIELEALTVPTFVPQISPQEQSPQSISASSVSPPQAIQPPMVAPPMPKEEVREIAPGAVTAPMPGKVLRVLVREGDRVSVGQGLLILEAMKMENEIPSPKDGVVKRILIKEGDTVDTGQPLIEIG